MVLVEGKINDKDGSAKILVDKVWPLDSVTPAILSPLDQLIKPNFGRGNWSNNAPTSARATTRQFTIELPQRTTKTVIEQLKTILLDHPGDATVELRIPHGGSTKIVQTSLKVKRSEELEEEVQQLLMRV